LISSAAPLIVVPAQALWYTRYQEGTAMTITATIMRQEERPGAVRLARSWQSPLCAESHVPCHGDYFGTAKAQDNPTGGSS